MYLTVSEIKTHFSKYLKLVQEGETVIVTSHQHPVAQLIPIVNLHAREIFKKESLCHFSWNGKKPKGGKLQPEIHGLTAAERILEDRGR